jgi:starch synthase
MADSVRILFASSEVKPFASVSPMAEVIRNVPEYLHEQGDFQSRIMMPRYGTISERRNRLHEVIRLSGGKIPLVKDEESLKVKVASIPGIRLQVYFMDNVKYFKRKGQYADRDGKLFSDNRIRAILFARSVLHTAKNLGWAPNVVHAHGWLAALVPALIRTQYAEEPLFSGAKIIYSSDAMELEERFTEEEISALGISGADSMVDQDLHDIGASFSDVLVYTDPSLSPKGDARLLSKEPEELEEQAIALYGELARAADVKV